MLTLTSVDNPINVLKKLGITFRNFEGKTINPDELRPLVVKYIKLFEFVQARLMDLNEPPKSKRGLHLRKSLQVRMNDLQATGARFKEDAKATFRKINVTFPGDQEKDTVVVTREAVGKATNFVEWIISGLTELHIAIDALRHTVMEAERILDSGQLLDKSLKLMNDVLAVAPHFQKARSAHTMALYWIAYFNAGNYLSIGEKPELYITIQTMLGLDPDMSRRWSPELKHLGRAILFDKGQLEPPKLAIKINPRRKAFDQIYEWLKATA